MPNQRAKSKAFIGLFIDAKLKHRVSAVAKTQQMPLSGFVTQAIVEYSEKLQMQSESVAPRSKSVDIPTGDESTKKLESGLVAPVDDVWLL